MKIVKCSSKFPLFHAQKLNISSQSTIIVVCCFYDPVTMYLLKEQKNIEHFVIDNGETRKAVNLMFMITTFIMRERKYYRMGRRLKTDESVGVAC